MCSYVWGTGGRNGSQEPILSRSSVTGVPCLDFALRDIPRTKRRALLRVGNSLP